MIERIFVECFYSDGRGPTLQELHWEDRGRILVGIDYVNPDDETLRHVLLHGLQAFMVTPEEVIGPAQVDDSLSRFRPAAMFNLGRSAWYNTFDDHHLAKCSHYQFHFYDELVDVICESVECGTGSASE